MYGYSKSNSPLLIYQPYNIAVLLTFYSPLVITILILSISFVFQNFKGFGFLFWLIVFSWLRSLLLEITGSKPLESSQDNICEMVQYSKYGNSTFSMFFISFSLVYLCTPMILNNQVNYWILSAFLFYLLLDASIRYYSGCINKMSDVFTSTVLGLGSGLLSIMTFYMMNKQEFLFFNEMSSTKDVCSMPSKQTFKCNVYKNGELIGQTNG